MRTLFDSMGRRKSQTVQINTSLFSLMREGLDVSNTEMEPLFGDDLDQPIRFWKDQDPLYYETFDPIKMKMQRDKERTQDASPDNAAKLNPVYNS